MKPIARGFLAVLTGLLAVAAAIANDVPSEPLVWFDAPATHFTQSCPLGNGRLGAMVFGGVDEERVVLNESGMWSGSPQDADRPDAAAALPEIRRLLLEGRNGEAEKLVNDHFTCAGRGSGYGSGANVPYGCYQVLGNLRLKFDYGGVKDMPQNYRRELNLAEAVTRVEFVRGGVHFVREAFVSAPDEAMVLRLTADRPGALSFDLTLDRPEHVETAAVGSDGLRMTGRLNNGVDGKGVIYAAQLRALPVGGTVAVLGRTLQVRGADEAVLLVTAATDMQSFAGRRSDDPVGMAAGDLARGAGKPYAELRRAHVAAYQSRFNRTRLRLGPANDAASALPTPARLVAMQQGGADPGLMALYFDFGRYLLISASRPGGLPANLQGIWAEEIQTPWNGDWHLNVNVQMNYWPAESCNLSDLTQPLFALVSSLQKPGAQTAWKYYGARGWVAHVITNPWGFTSPGEGADWGATTTGSAWLCTHLWDHYLFTGDRAFLVDAYPVLKGSAQFYADMLIEEPSHHWLVTAPSNSPENAFLLPDGAKAHICLGATMDMQLLRYLFGACIEASRILGVDEDFRKELEAKRPRLAPTRIATDGRIMEWLEEYREDDPHHRHVSHLWGLYPGFEINRQTTPALAEAARKSLEARGDSGTGWGIAYKAALWARLGDGNRAWRLLANLLRPAQSAGGTYPNLFDSCPPFQIDGNFGAAAGIAEMLLQSRIVEPAGAKLESEIELLPALPDAWAEGGVRGLRARGGFEVGLRWEKGRLTEARIVSLAGHRLQVRYGGKTAVFDTTPGQVLVLDGSLQSR
jgi:alpha-L-fucosidase 2